MKKKHFYVVTYDISDTKRREKVVKLLESIGHRMNYSVFECMLTDIQYRNMRERLARVALPKDDKINIYPLCAECYARIHYLPERSRAIHPEIVVV